LRSRRQSDTSKLRDSLVFFLDRSLGKTQLAEALKGEGFRIEVHDAHFSPTEEDPIWLAECGRQKWVVITADKKIEKRHLDAIIEAKVAVFLIASNTAEQWAERVLKCRHKIEQVLTWNEPPLIAHIGKEGKLTRLNGQPIPKTGIRKGTVLKARGK
jgi:hypothetical protein